MVIYSQIGRACYVTACQQVGRGLAPRRDFVYPLDDGRDLVTWTWEVLPPAETEIVMVLAVILLQNPVVSAIFTHLQGLGRVGTGKASTATPARCWREVRRRYGSRRARRHRLF